MVKVKATPSRDKLNEIFAYSEGQLLCKVRRGPLKIGDVAGSVDKKGYVRVGVEGESYYAHRLIYKLVHGEDAEQVDHINGVKTDNRISNLRSVSNRENGRNRKVSSNNSSGCPGVSWNCKGRLWEVRINADGRRIFLGGYSDIDLAIAVRKAAEVQYGYHENHGKRLL